MILKKLYYLSNIFLRALLLFGFWIFTSVSIFNRAASLQLSSGEYLFQLWVFGLIMFFYSIRSSIEMLQLVSLWFLQF